LYADLGPDPAFDFDEYPDPAFPSDADLNPEFSSLTFKTPTKNDIKKCFLLIIFE
jgi:hypothetical protein